MAARQHGFRGLSQDQELNSKDLYRDIRTPTQKVADFFSDNPGVAQFVAALLVLPVFASPTFFILVCLPIIYWVTSHPYSHRQTLPMLLPEEAGITDLNDPKPGRFGYFKSRGQFLLGNVRFARRPYELWLSFVHLLTHTLVIGSTGAGKTETLVSMAANYLAVGSGVMYSDAKAAPKLGWQIFTLARYFGREHDFRALNYIKGNTSAKKDPAVRRGNNVNLFTYGSSESITQIIVSIMPPGGNENKLFSERAIGLISAVMPALIDLRDCAGLLITPAVIRKSLELTEVEKLRDHPRITAESREAIRAYLASLPGYNPDPGRDARGNKKKQPEEVGRQFGFAQAYFTRALSSLSDTYGDIYMVGRGEINFLDMILRRRIGVVMIPALEKAPDEMKNLAKIVLAAQKNAISTGIPPEIEGRKADILESLPITAPVPYGIINDEFAFMMTPGYGVTLAQARGLYVAITIAGQDYAGMKREDPDEAEQIAENTKVKIVMASEGLGATAELIKQIAGEGLAMAASNYARDEQSLTGMYRDSQSASVERRSRIDTMDTRAQVEGEGIVFWRDKIVPVSMFYHGFDDKTISDHFAINRMLDVNLPTRGYGATLLKPKSDYQQAMEGALQKGLYLSKSDLELPPALEFIGKACSDWQSILKKQPTITGREREGLLFGALLYSNDEITDLIDAGTPDDQLQPIEPAPAPSTTAAENPQKSVRKATETTVVSEPISTPAEPEPVLDEGLMEDDWDEEDAFDAVPDPKARELEISARLDEIEHSHAKSMLEKAPWAIDPTLLKAVTPRAMTEGESRLAQQAAETTSRIEMATGTAAEEAQKIGLATATAVMASIEYPSNVSHAPTPPQSDEEKRELIERTTSALENWLNAGDDHDDHISEQ